MSRIIAGFILCALTGAVLPMSACIQIGPGDDGGDGGGDSSPELTVRFENHTLRAVDVQLYATGQPVNILEADLFAPANQVTQGIGFAGSGVIQAGASDEVVLTCANVNTIGTRGGRFLDQDSGEQVGIGQQRVLFLGLQFACGDQVTFIYSSSGGGFQTSLRIE
jgi:hypothetical protein